MRYFAPLTCVLVAAWALTAASQLTLAFPEALLALYGPEERSSIPRNLSFVIALRYPGNSLAFERPFNGTLVSLPVFRELVANGTSSFATPICVLLDGLFYPFIGQLREIQASGGECAIAGNNLLTEAGEARFVHDASDLTQIKIAVFQVGSSETSALFGAFYSSDNRTRELNLNNVVSIVGLPNIYEQVYLSPASYVLQALILLLDLVTLGFLLYVLFNKYKMSKCKLTIAVHCLQLLICGLILRFIFFIDPLGRSGIFHAWFIQMTMSWHLPFFATALLIILFFWSTQMKKKGIGNSINFAQRAPTILGSIIYVESTVVYIAYAILRDRLNSPLLYLAYIFSAVATFGFAIYFVAFIIYTSLMTKRFIEDSKDVKGTSQNLNRVKFTRRLLITEIALLVGVIVLSIILWNLTFPRFQFGGYFMLHCLMNAMDVLTALILHGKLTVKGSANDPSSLSTNSGNSSARLSTKKSIRQILKLKSKDTVNEPTVGSTLSSHNDDNNDDDDEGEEEVDDDNIDEENKKPHENDSASSSNRENEEEEKEKEKEGDVDDAHESPSTSH